MATVLWGRRRGDVQYGSRAYWRRNIPIRPGVQRLAVSSTAYFDVGDALMVYGPLGNPDYAWIEGIEGGSLGVRS